MGQAFSTSIRKNYPEETLAHKAREAVADPAPGTGETAFVTKELMASMRV